MQNGTIPTKVKKNGIEWTVRKGYEDLQDRFNLTCLHSALQKIPHTIIKDTKVRSVFFIPDSDTNMRGIYVKCFKERDSRDFNKYLDCVKHLFVRTKAETEWNVGNRLLSKEINTALPLAIAENRSWFFRKNSMLITGAIPDSKSLIDFCQSSFHDTQSEEASIRKKNLINTLAEFVRDIHSKGFFHSDFHAGNILIQFHHDHTGQDQPYSFYLIDLHHVKILKTLSKRKILYNLAQLFNSLSSSLTQYDRRQFFQSYGKDSFGKQKERQKLVDQIDTISCRLRFTHYKSRLKRCLKRSSLFSKRKFDGFTIFFRKGYDTEFFFDLLEKHDTALAHKLCDTILKQDRKTILTRHPFQDKEIQTVVVKHYKSPPGFGLIKNSFRKSPGKKAWISGNGLLLYGFDAPLPLTLIEKRVLGVVTDSYLIMEAVSHSLEMDRYIVKNFHDQEESRLPVIVKMKRSFIDQFAQIIAKMHNKRVFHHDLKTCNIMVKANSAFDFTFLDFDKVTFGKNVRIRERIRNLTQINLSTPGCITLKDRLRFLGEYLRQCNLQEAKRTIRNEISAMSKREKILYVTGKGDVTEDW
ncbi:MAG: AarF/UbiB family protein [Candidatus Scalindua sp.]|nr:AarF/UbiB family protein [Candidatus Scalindua sp.]